MALLLTFAATARAQSAEIGDRLVVSINNVPYTQRQVEAYVTVKESLRPGAAFALDWSAGKTWDDALSVFTEEMVILQESQRLGSFQIQNDLLNKYLREVRERQSKSRELDAALRRLEVDGVYLERTLEAVLRIVAFRRGKERPGGREEGEGGQAKDGGQGAWLRELLDRAVSWRYAGASTYLPIRPRPGGGADGG